MAEVDAASAKLAAAGPRGESTLLRSAEGRRLDAALRAGVRDLAAKLSLSPGEDAFHAADAQMDAANRVLGALAGIALNIRGAVDEHERAAVTRWKTTISFVSLVSLSVILGGAVLGVYQYRSVITPLGRLAGATRTMAAGKFSERVELRGASEFTALADDFNRMAAELEALYRELEEKVAAKSRELVRSERLASVGFLAAGVAHEINNPLGIISGYAERALGQLEREPNQSSATLAVKHLRIICDEAFRCKAITDRLLSMARPGEDFREAISLDEVAAEVVHLVEGLPRREGRKVSLARSNGAAIVLANRGEMKQVLLNLVLNGLDAITTGGEVKIEVQADEQRVRVIVRDDGRGISPETLHRVFEPFFTEKRGAQPAGTGLGLSIAHAMIESHGGRIHAASDGPGRGSCFIIDLPAHPRGVGA